jgi:hypothetical protein
MPPAYVAWRASTSNRVVLQWPARLGIDSWAPLKVYKFGLSKPWKEEQNWVRTTGNEVQDCGYSLVYPTKELITLFQKNKN